MATSSPPAAVGYANARVTKVAEWHGLVAADVFLNNLATGSFLVAATADLTLPHTLAAVAAWAYPVALVILLADLVCLVLDLGDPWRFHHMLRIVKPSSPMSLGVWCLTCFSFPLTALVALDLLATVWSVPRWLHVLCVVAALLPAFGSVAYKGVLFSTSAQPGWQQARWLGGYLVSSALALGCAIMLALALWRSPQEVTTLRAAFGLLVALSAVPLLLLVVDIRAVLPRVYPRNRLIGLAVVAGSSEMVLPLVLLSIGDGPILLLTAVVCFVLGALLLRMVLIQLPHAQP